ASAGMLPAAAVTLRAVMEGLLIAVVSGTLIGLAMGRIKVVDRLLKLYVNGLYAMPMVAILPLLTIWFGYSSAARLATVVFASFFPIAMNASDGARSVPAEYLEVARACRARWTDVWFGITLPSSLPYLLAGLRLAIGRAPGLARSDPATLHHRAEPSPHPSGTAKPTVPPKLDERTDFSLTLTTLDALHNKGMMTDEEYYAALRQMISVGEKAATSPPFVI